MEIIGNNIYFMGFMATGKTEVGKAVARLMGRPFADTDSLIEQQAGKTIAQIFTDSGEAEFRRLERDLVRKVTQQNHWVIALGGGAILDKVSWQLISQSGISICLTASLDVLCDRLARKQNRPLVANFKPEELRTSIQTLLEKRAPFYQKAMFTFESRTDLAPEELALRIIHTVGLL